MRSSSWRTNIWYIVVSLTLSFFLWLALAGHNMNTMELSVSLELDQIPVGFALGSELPFSVEVQLLANTAQMRILDDQKFHLKLNAATTIEGHNTLVLDTDSLDLPRGVLVRQIIPSTISFTLIKFTDQLMPLTPILLGQPDPSFRVKSVTLDPPQVTLKGPHELLQTITTLSTKPLNISGLKASVTRLVAPDLTAWKGQGIESRPNEIQAIIQIGERQNVESFTDLPLVLDFKNGAHIKPGDITIIPDKVAVEVSWPASRLEAVNPQGIQPRVQVDVEKLKKNLSLTPPVVVVTPQGVKLTAVNPVYVEVRYTPPESPTPLSLLISTPNPEPLLLPGSTQSSEVPSPPTFIMETQ